MRRPRTYTAAQILAGELYTVKEAAKKLRISDRTIWRLVATKQLATIQNGTSRKALIPACSISDYLVERLRGAEVA